MIFYIRSVQYIEYGTAIYDTIWEWYDDNVMWCDVRAYKYEWENNWSIIINGTV